MKRLLSVFLLILLALPLAGCTAEEPGHFFIENTDPIPVELDGSQPVEVVDEDGDSIAINEDTGALGVLEFGHYQIHEGNSFSCWYEQDVSDIGDKTIIVLQTANSTTWLHLIWTASATSLSHMRMLEDPVVTDNTGETLPIYNRDRNSVKTSTVIDTSTAANVTGQATYFTEATQGNVAGGTQLSETHLGVEQRNMAEGGDSRGSQEWILKQGTYYAFVVESVDAEDNTQMIKLHWYELRNRE